MFADTIQKSVLEWLQLTPELLSGLSGRPVVGAKPVAAPAPALQNDSTDVASIDLHSVLPASAGMSFHHPAAPATNQQAEPWQQLVAEAYPATGRAYASMDAGGSQRAALAEMTGYLTTRLAPSPTKTGD